MVARQSDQDLQGHSLITIIFFLATECYLAYRDPQIPFSQGSLPDAYHEDHIWQIWGPVKRVENKNFGSSDSEILVEMWGSGYTWPQTKFSWSWSVSNSIISSLRFWFMNTRCRVVNWFFYIVSRWLPIFFPVPGHHILYCPKILLV